MARYTLNTTLRITNWVAIAFFGFSVLAIAAAEPSASLVSAANLLPFGAVLIAVREDSTRFALWSAAALNVLWAVLCVTAAVIVLAGLGGMLFAVPFLLAIAVPCALNARVVWRKLRERA